MRVVRLFVLTLFATTIYARSNDIYHAVKSALNWYYRWMETIPRERASIECSAVFFPGKSFVLCGSVAVSMNLEMPYNGAPRVVFMGHEPSSFDVALAAFRRNTQPNGPPVGPVRKYSIAVRNLGGCAMDSYLTARAPLMVLTKDVRTAMLSSGHSFRFPIICRGDPFYLVYCLAGEQILWIWLYEIDGDHLEFRWSFDAGTQQRPIPRQSIENLKKKEFWYKTEGAWK